MERSKLWVSLVFFMFIVSAVPSYAEEVAEIEAMSLLYIPDESKVVGEGDVVIRHRDFKVSADRVVYLVDRGEIFSESILGRKVKISRNEYDVYAESLYYNLFERRGFLKKAETYEDGIILKGENVDFRLTDQVPARKFLFFKSPPKRLKEPGYEFSVTNGRFTTCKLYNPYYYISGAKVILYPDGTIRVVRPSIYIGGSKLLTLPFDYSFNIEAKEIPLLAPVVGYTSTLGWYGGLVFKNSSAYFPFTIALLYSEKQNFVGKADGSIKLSEGWRFYFDIERSEEWEGERLKWRTALRFTEKTNNTELSLSYIKDRKLWVLRDDVDIKAVYSALPEVYFKYSVEPFTFFLRWGDYEEGDVRRGKVTIGGSLSEEKRITESLKFNVSITYLKDYYESDEEREILYHEEMLRWGVGKFALVGGYLERKVFGDTPFYFDKYDPLRKYLLGAEYSSDSMKVKSYFYYDDLKNGWRDLIGEVSLNLGTRAFLSIKPWYYLDEGNWREVDYRVIYYLCPCGCTSLELAFHDDLRKENDDVLWIRLYVSSAAFSLVSGEMPQKDSLIPP